VSRAPDSAPASKRQKPVVRNAATNSSETPAKLFQLNKTSPTIITPDMLPNSKWKIVGSDVTYTIGDETIMEFDKNIPKEKAWNKTIWFPVNPKCIVDSVSCPSKLPAPISKTNIPKECLQFPAMMMLPKPKLIKTHAGKCQCVVLGQRETYHRESVLHDSCLLDNVTQQKMAVAPCTKEPFVKNPSRFYYWNSELRDHCLALPMPFRNGTSWTPIHFSPAMSGCPNNSARKLYYGLYSTMKAKEIGAVYMRQPKEWTASNHPCISEAPEGSELGYITISLYGLETIPRVNYTHHPLADQHFLLFIAALLEERPRESPVPCLHCRGCRRRAPAGVPHQISIHLSLGPASCVLLHCRLHLLCYKLEQPTVPGLRHLHPSQARRSLRQTGGQAGGQPAGHSLSLDLRILGHQKLPLKENPWRWIMSTSSESISLKMIRWNPLLPLAMQSWMATGRSLTPRTSLWPRQASPRRRRSNIYNVFCCAFGGL